MNAELRGYAFMGDEKSEQLEYIMRRFGDKVLKIAYYYLRDRHLAEDISQEVFCRVYQNLDSFRGESSYYTWIYRITVNLCRDYMESAYCRRVFPWGIIGRRTVPTDSTNRMLEAVEGGRIFQKVMDLPSDYRTVVALYYFEELPVSQIAEILNLREGAVRTRLCRARKMLKDILSREVL